MHRPSPPIRLPGEALVTRICRAGLVLSLASCSPIERDVIVSRGKSEDAGGQVPILLQDFTQEWSGTSSPDGQWRISGPWVGSGNNELDPDNASLSTAGTGLLSLTVPAGSPNRGAEVSSTGTSGSSLSYGYYEARLKVTSEPGACVSFFWLEADNAGGRIEVTFLTNESWNGTSDSGQVHWMVSPNPDVNQTHFVQALAFCPSCDLHRYGWLWTPNLVSFTVDCAIAHTFTRPPANNIANPRGGSILANAWTGDPNWGGGPPNSPATSTVDWIRVIPGIESVPCL